MHLATGRYVYSGDQVKIKAFSMKDAELPWRSSGRPVVARCSWYRKKPPAMLRPNAIVESTGFENQAFAEQSSNQPLNVFV